MENIIYITSHMNNFNYLRLITEEGVNKFYYNGAYCPKAKLLSKGLKDISDLVNGGCKLISNNYTDTEHILCREYIYCLSKDKKMNPKVESNNEFSYCILSIFRELDSSVPVESKDEIYLILDGEIIPIHEDVIKNDYLLSVPTIFEERNSSLVKVLIKLNELGSQGWEVVDFNRKFTHKIKEYYSDEYLWLLKR